MKPNKEQLEAYKAMAKASPDSMKAKIRSHLETNCPKFAGNEDRLDDCLDYLTDCAREILDSKSGEVADEVCYRICRDYFDDELWNVEEVKTKAEAVKAQAEAEAKVPEWKKNEKPQEERLFPEDERERKRRYNREALKALVAIVKDETTAKAIITAIAKEAIPHIHIDYT